MQQLAAKVATARTPLRQIEAMVEKEDFLDPVNALLDAIQLLDEGAERTDGARAVRRDLRVALQTQLRSGAAAQALDEMAPILSRLAVPIQMDAELWRAPAAEGVGGGGAPAGCVLGPGEHWWRAGYFLRRISCGLSARVANGGVGRRLTVWYAF